MRGQSLPVARAVADTEVGPAFVEARRRKLGIATVGAARIKLSRMDAAAHPQERHDHPGVLALLDGRVNPTVEGVFVPVRADAMVRVDAGTLRGVCAGSHGTLSIFDLSEHSSTTQDTP